MNIELAGNVMKTILHLSHRLHRPDAAQSLITQPQGAGRRSRPSVAYLGFSIRLRPAVAYLGMSIEGLRLYEAAGLDVDAEHGVSSRAAPGIPGVKVAGAQRTAAEQRHQRHLDRYDTHPGHALRV